jgi:hypothetical protein
MGACRCLNLKGYIRQNEKYFKPVVRNIVLLAYLLLFFMSKSQFVFYFSENFA